MKYSYMSQTGDQAYDGDLTLSGKSIRCYSRESMKRLYPDGNYELLGFCVPGGKKNNDGSDTILLGGRDYALSDPDKLASGRKILGYVSVGDNRYVAVVKGGVPLPIWLTVGLVMLVPLTALLLSVLRPKEEPKTALTPDYELSELDPNLVDSEIEAPEDPVTLREQSGDYTAVRFDLTCGKVTIGELESELNGKAHLKLTMSVDEESYLVLDTDTELTEGKAPELALDYTILHVELKQGKYLATLSLTMEDGSVREYPVVLSIVSSSGGSVSFGFSDAVRVNRASGQVSMNLSVGAATHNTIVQLIAVQNGQEYLLAESGTIPEGKALTSMTLSEEGKSLLSPGVYNGVLRLNFYNEEKASTNTNTDIQVRITVE